MIVSRLRVKRLSADRSRDLGSNGARVNGSPKSAVQLREGGEHMPAARSNHRREESICPRRGPITGGRGAYITA
eukprot:6198244-Pyramimonas_sp.AAC.1